MSFINRCLIIQHTVNNIHILIIVLALRTCLRLYSIPINNKHLLTTAHLYLHFFFDKHDSVNAHNPPTSLVRSTSAHTSNPATIRRRHFRTLRIT